jgi:hypothetical protein
MREILFRAKLNKTDKWEAGSYAIVNGAHYIVPEEPIWDADKDAWTPRFWEVRSNTVCQFTGKYDKNKERIWENDIVKIDGKDGVFTVEWDEDTARFCIPVSWYKVGFEELCFDEIEVVGNIFDNPELLEVEV